MKKILLVSICAVCLLLFHGCGKKGEKDILKELTKKIENSSAYHV